METITINGEEYIKKPNNLTNNEDTYCIVRSNSAGAFAGWVNLGAWQANSEILAVRSARRLWYWSGAASLSQLAMEGVKNPQECKFPVELPEVFLVGVIEVIPATKKCKDSVNGVEVWKA